VCIAILNHTLTRNLNRFDPRGIKITSKSKKKCETSILERAEDARESREKTQMTATYESYMTHPGGKCLFASNFLILFALIGVIRGQFPDLD
jgi:hypothetical protein